METSSPQSDRFKIIAIMPNNTPMVPSKADPGLTSDLDWTCLAPAGIFEPGQRTGIYRLGQDNLVVNDKGERRISMEDFAIAMVDELESMLIPGSAFRSVTRIHFLVRATLMNDKAGIGGAATLPVDGPTGGFFRDGKRIPF